MLPLILRQAMTTMLSGRPGPVNVDVPFNVFQEEDDVEVPPRSHVMGQHRPGAADSDVQKTVEMLAEATRRAVRGWGLEIMCRDPKYYSPTITAVMLPEGHDADALRSLALETFNISYGMSFGRYAGKMFRIGHLGDMNDLTLLGALAGTEMALQLAGVPHRKGGVQAAMDYTASAMAGPARAAAE